MTKGILLLFLLGGFSAFAKDSPNQIPVKTVEHVDLTRYLGKWYQIAAIPQFFERNCFSNTLADYSLAESDSISVYNTCSDRDGKMISATGRAKVVDSNSNAKLKVTFLKFFNWLYLAGGDYWILDLDTNYRWVIVGEQTHKYGWILARDPYLSDADLTMLNGKLKQQGYDTCKFLTARQNGGASSRVPLCLRFQI